jgi:hypothetical protein
MPQNNDHD